MEFSTRTVDDQTSLTLIGIEDAAEVFSLVDTCRAGLRPWLPWVDTTKSIKDTEFFIKSAMAQFENNEAFHCCIRSDGRIAGVLGFHKIDKENRATELGYWLGQDYQGKGIMTRCCRLFTDYAFTQLNVHRVEIRAGAENIRSRAIPERLGYTKEGTLREAEWVNDRFLNSVVYSMLQREWEKKGNPQL